MCDCTLASRQNSRATQAVTLCGWKWCAMPEEPGLPNLSARFDGRYQVEATSGMTDLRKRQTATNDSPSV
jgi:hypothetical protein